MVNRQPIQNVNEATTDTMGPMSMGMIIVPPLPPGRALDPAGRVLGLPLPPGSAQDSLLFPRRILGSNGTDGIRKQQHQ